MLLFIFLRLDAYVADSIKKAGSMPASDIGPFGSIILGAHILNIGRLFHGLEEGTRHPCPHWP